MTRVAQKASARLVGIRRRSRRAGLLRSTALQAAVLVAIELPGGIRRPAAAQTAPNARPQGGRVTAGQATIVRADRAARLPHASSVPAATASTRGQGRVGFNLVSQQPRAVHTFLLR